MTTFELIINEQDEHSGVDAISLVDRPATESDWQIFNDQKPECFKKTDIEGVFTGYFMISDKVIYRNNEELGEHNIFFSKETIGKIQMKFMSRNFNLSANIMHNPNLALDDVVIFEHWIIDKEKGKLPPKGFKVEADGSWFGSMYIPPHLTKLREAALDGKLNGFSVEGYFSYKKPEETTEEKMLSQIKELLKGI